MSLGRIATDNLAVEFRRHGDRISHAVFVRDDIAGAWRECLSSLEGAADEAWPASPALQELHIEERGGRPVAMLVGRAGISHWSASFEFADERLVVDVACRTTARPEWLGSAYALVDPNRIGCNLAAEPPSLLAPSSDGSRVAIRPPSYDGPWPATVRWRFAVL